MDKTLVVGHQFAIYQCCLMPTFSTIQVCTFAYINQRYTDIGSNVSADPGCIDKSLPAYTTVPLFTMFYSYTISLQTDIPTEQ